MEKEKVYQKTWFTILFLILFFPVGLFTMWKYKKFNKVARIIISAIFALAVISSFFGSDSDTDSSNSTTAATTESTTAKTTAAKTTTTKATTTAKKKKLTKKDYNPQITYNNLARTPDKYEYERITFQGKVIQVIEDDTNDQTQIRLATNDNSDKVMYVVIPREKLKERLLEDDHIRFYGVSAGLISYKSTMGGKITIPSALAENVTLLNE